MERAPRDHHDRIRNCSQIFPRNVPAAPVPPGGRFYFADHADESGGGGPYADIEICVCCRRGAGARLLWTAQTGHRVTDVGRCHESFKRFRMNFVIEVQREPLDLVGSIELQLLAGYIATPAAERRGHHSPGICIDGYHVRAENSCDE